MYVFPYVENAMSVEYFCCKMGPFAAVGYATLINSTRKNGLCLTLARRISSISRTFRGNLLQRMYVEFFCCNMAVIAVGIHPIYYTT